MKMSQNEFERKQFDSRRYALASSNTKKKGEKEKYNGELGI